MQCFGEHISGINLCEFGPFLDHFGPFAEAVIPGCNTTTLLLKNMFYASITGNICLFCPGSLGTAQLRRLAMWSFDGCGLPPIALACIDEARAS